MRAGPRRGGGARATDVSIVRWRDTRMPGQLVRVPSILVKACINQRSIVAAACGRLSCLRHVGSPAQVDRPLRHCVPRARSVCGDRAPGPRGHSHPGVPLDLSASAVVRRACAPPPGRGCSTRSEPDGHRQHVAGGTAVHAGRQPADARVAFTAAKRSVFCRPIAPRSFDRYFAL